MLRRSAMVAQGTVNAFFAIIRLWQKIKENTPIVLPISNKLS